MTEKRRDAKRQIWEDTLIEIALKAQRIEQVIKKRKQAAKKTSKKGGEK